MRSWQVVRYGKPSEALELRDLPTPEPGPGEVRLRVSHAPANWNDIDGCHGRYRTIKPPLPYSLGMEALGTIEAAGAGAERWLGRRVIATTAGAQGAYSEEAIAPADMIFDAPESLSDEEAAAIFFPFHVAYLSLFVRGRLQQGETVLVHSGAGGVGSAAIQLAASAGARVFATAGSAARVAFCRELGAEVAIDYTQHDFADVVLEATDGKGVDVIVDLVGKPVWESGFRAIAFGGRYVQAGFSGGIEAEDDAFTPRPVLFGNCDYAGVLLAYGDSVAVKRAAGINIVPREIGEQVQRALDDAFARGAIRPIVAERMPFAELPQALERLATRSVQGRLILAW